MVFGVPHYVTRQTMDSVKAVLIPRIQGITEDAVIQMALNPGKSPAAEQVQPTGGVAVIPVHGILVPRRGQITAMCSELTSYERIRGQLQAALNDPSISEIVLDINSGGGAAVGCKELADYIYQSRDTKPITAIVNYSAYSAAYFIASACSKIIVSQTSGVGSIGVIMEHLDTSKMEEKMGLTFTTIYRGDNKNNGTQHEPLSEESLGIRALSSLRRSGSGAGCHPRHAKTVSRCEELSGRECLSRSDAGETAPFLHRRKAL